MFLNQNLQTFIYIVLIIPKTDILIKFDPNECEEANELLENTLWDYTIKELFPKKLSYDQNIFALSGGAKGGSKGAKVSKK